MESTLSYPIRRIKIWNEREVAWPVRMTIRKQRYQHNKEVDDSIIVNCMVFESICGPTSHCDPPERLLLKRLDVWKLLERVDGDGSTSWKYALCFPEEYVLNFWILRKAVEHPQESPRGLKCQQKVRMISSALVAFSITTICKSVN